MCPCIDNQAICHSSYFTRLIRMQGHCRRSPYRKCNICTKICRDRICEMIDKRSGIMDLFPYGCGQGRQSTHPTLTACPSGPYPRPGLKLFSRARIRYSRALETASFNPHPALISAAMAELRVHPVPWVLLVLILGEINFLISSPEYRISTTVSPSMCPPFTRTAPGPRSYIFLAAISIVLTSVILIPQSFSASGIFGVTRDARGRSSFWIEYTASGPLSSSPL